MPTEGFEKGKLYYKSEDDKEYKELEEEKKNSISKQKIKDKIKELANIKGDLATYIATSEKIKALEELLEENE